MRNRIHLPGFPRGRLARIFPASPAGAPEPSGVISSNRTAADASSVCENQQAGTRLVKSFAKRRRSDGARRITLMVSVVLAVGYVAFLRPAEGLSARSVRLSSLAARPAADAFGRSGQLKMRFALPGLPVDYPVEIEGGLEKI